MDGPSALPRRSLFDGDRRFAGIHPVPHVLASARGDMAVAPAGTPRGLVRPDRSDGRRVHGTIDEGGFLAHADGAPYGWMSALGDVPRRNPFGNDRRLPASH